MLRAKLLTYIVCICLFSLCAKAQTGKSKTAEDLHKDAINRHRDQIEHGGNFTYSYASCGNVFPIASGRNKKIVFSGYIKTAGLIDGWAGLWWRIDRKFNVYDIKNMRLNGPSGSTDWQQFSITMHAKTDATNMDFGCLMVGNGKAWFDKLSIEIDGIEYNDSAAMAGIYKDSLPYLNLDFESLNRENQVAAWSTEGEDKFVVRIDSTIKYNGKYSLMMGPKAFESSQTKQSLAGDVIKPVETTTTPISHNEPNPDSIKISLKKNGTGTEASAWILNIETTAKINVSIFSTDKKLLIHKDDTKSIDVSELPNGAYIVEVYDEKGLLLKSNKVRKEVEQ